jgi:hypothetical protein
VLGLEMAARERAAPRPLDRRVSGGGGLAARHSGLAGAVYVAKQHPVSGDIRGPADTQRGYSHAPGTGRNGALREARGILYGRPFGDQETFEAYDGAILQVLAELGLSSLPLVTRMDFGHTDPKFVLPLGVEAEIDCDRQEIRLLEAPANW